MSLWLIQTLVLIVLIVGGLWIAQYLGRKRIERKVGSVVRQCRDQSHKHASICPACEKGKLIRYRASQNFTWKEKTVEIDLIFSRCDQCSEEVVEMGLDASYNDAQYTAARQKIDAMLDEEKTHMLTANQIGNHDHTPVTFPLGSHSPQYGFTVVEEGSNLLDGKTEPLFLKFHDLDEDLS